MEIPQGNSLCSYLYLRQAKNVIFLFLFFSFFLLQNLKAGDRNRSCPEGRVGTSEGGRWCGKRVGGEYGTKMYTHICKCKNNTHCSIAGIRRGGNKGEWWRGKFKYDIFETL
jgi:hypothetical protein